ncbi:MAG: hypothetical protein ABIK65_03865 [Candidatus Eisenbacteria bacterium]
MSVPFDVVTVPDFRPGKRPDFETRALFFLASWIDYGGAASGVPLHMVCVGEPPDSVRRRMRGRLDCPIPREHRYPGQAGDVHRMIPYYGGGVLWIPRGIWFGSLWADFIRRSARLFDDGVPGDRAVTRSDQVGLALAIARRGREGIPFRILPDSHHAHWLHIFRRAVPLREMLLFHAFRFAESVSAGGTSFAVGWYRVLLAGGMAAEAWHQDIARFRLSRPFREFGPALADSLALGRRLEELRKRHVEPALRP